MLHLPKPSYAGVIILSAATLYSATQLFLTIGMFSYYQFYLGWLFLPVSFIVKLLKRLACIDFLVQRIFTRHRLRTWVHNKVKMWGSKCPHCQVLESEQRGQRLFCNYPENGRRWRCWNCQKLENDFCLAKAPEGPVPAPALTPALVKGSGSKRGLWRYRFSRGQKSNIWRHLR